MTPLRILVLGGSGFIGRHLVARLAREGHQVRVLSRNFGTRYERHPAPGVEVREGDPYAPAVLDAALAGRDVAINLVGILNEPGDSGRGFQRAHVELTRQLVAACQRAGVRRLLQMSSLNAGRGRSHYLRSRGEAEAVVKASGLDWTIFQPSVVFGHGDGLYCRFAGLLALAPVIPLARAGTKFAPVYVGDVVEAFVRALRQPAAVGETYELYGPEVFTLADIVRQTAAQLGLRRFVLPLPDAIGRLQGLLMDHLPAKPFSSDNFRSLLTDSVGGFDGLHRLGIAPTPVARMLPGILGAVGDRQSRLDAYRIRR